MKLYWVEQDFIAEIEDEQEERFQDTRSGPGKGGEDPAPISGLSGAMMKEDEDYDESDHSDSGNESDGPTPNNGPGGPKGPKAKANLKPSKSKADLEYENALEAAACKELNIQQLLSQTPAFLQAAENVEEILEQVLKIRNKLEDQMTKLGAIKDSNSQQNLTQATSCHMNQPSLSLTRLPTPRSQHPN